VQRPAADIDRVGYHRGPILQRISGDTANQSSKNENNDQCLRADESAKGAVRPMTGEELSSSRA
jgi:hypothetical protein